MNVDVNTLAFILNFIVSAISVIVLLIKFNVAFSKQEEKVKYLEKEIEDIKDIKLELRNVKEELIKLQTIIQLTVSAHHVAN